MPSAVSCNSQGNGIWKIPATFQSDHWAWDAGRLLPFVSSAGRTGNARAAGVSKACPADSRWFLRLAEVPGDICSPSPYIDLRIDHEFIRNFPAVQSACGRSLQPEKSLNQSSLNISALLWSNAVTGPSPYGLQRFSFAKQKKIIETLFGEDAHIAFLQAAPCG